MWSFTSQRHNSCISLHSTWKCDMRPSKACICNGYFFKSYMNHSISQQCQAMSLFIYIYCFLIMWLFTQITGFKRTIQNAYVFDSETELNFDATVPSMATTGISPFRHPFENGSISLIISQLLRNKAIFWNGTCNGYTAFSPYIHESLVYLKYYLYIHCTKQCFLQNVNAPFTLHTHVMVW